MPSDSFTNAPDVPQYILRTTVRQHRPYVASSYSNLTSKERAARQLTRTPTAAQRLDQCGAGDETALPDVDGGLGISESGLLCDDDTGIGDGAGQILVVDEMCLRHV